MHIRNFFQELFHFRNESHEHWFYFTIILFIIFSIGSLLLKRNEGLGFLSCFFFGTSVSAIFVYVFRIHSNAYSVDCIWYNALIGVLCLWVSSIIEKRKTFIIKNRD